MPNTHCVWTEVAKLTASDGAGERHYGENVAVSNGTIVVVPAVIVLLRR